MLKAGPESSFEPKIRPSFSTELRWRFTCAYWFGCRPTFGVKPSLIQSWTEKKKSPGSVLPTFRRRSRWRRRLVSASRAASASPAICDRFHQNSADRFIVIATARRDVMQSLLGDNPLSYLACLTRCTRKAAAVDDDSTSNRSPTSSPLQKVGEIRFFQLCRVSQ